MPADDGLTPRHDVEALVAASDVLVGELVAPPAFAAASVCPLCHSWKPDDLLVCGSCEVTGRTVDFPVGPVSVVTLMAKPSALRDWLTRYKGRPGDEDPFDPAAFDRVRAIAGRYLLEHGPGLLSRIGPVDQVVVVPSGGDRPVPHPLEQVLASLRFGLPITQLLTRGPGFLNFRVSAIDGYRCRAGEPASRVLLGEDAFVTGARVFSAARALQDAGHTVAGVLSLARRVNRDWGRSGELWDNQAAERFTWPLSPLTAEPDADLIWALRASAPPTTVDIDTRTPNEPATTSGQAP